MNVEDVCPGDFVRTWDNDIRAVKAVQSITVRPRRAAKPLDVLPVRVRANAFADGMPVRDLVVSPGHALFVGGVLINACDLVNGATIVQEDAEIVEYHHIELDSHDILVADGMPCESYLDDGNRASFHNGTDPIHLHGRLDRVSPHTCRPLVRDGAQLAVARAQVLARAIEIGWALVDRPRLRIMLGEAELAPVAVVGKRAWFLLPDDTPASIRLRSAAGIINRVVPQAGDDRRLGVAVGEVRIDGVPVALDGIAFGEGFYPVETAGETSWRWTNGDAVLLLPVSARVIELNVQMILPTLRQPEDGQPRLAQAG